MRTTGRGKTLDYNLTNKPSGQIPQKWREKRVNVKAQPGHTYEITV